MTGRPRPARPQGPADPGGAADLEERTQRLLRWYPADWRARYGEEFAGLLVADLSERPRCRRTADVVRSGLTARLASAGLTGYPADPGAAGRTALAALACAVAVFLIFGAAMWAQLTVGWQWSPPAGRATQAAMVVMSATMPLFATAALLAVVPLARAAVQTARRGGGRRLRGPALLISASATVLVVGARHFGNGWPGTGGPWWPHQGLVPGGVAAFAWACTLPVTSYWAHPAALAAFPAAEQGWLLVCPLTLASMITGIARLIRRVPLPPRVIRYEAVLARLTGTAMVAFLAAAWCWTADGVPGPHGLFRTGTIDAGALVLMMLALVTGGLALRQVVRAGSAEALPGPPVSVRR